MSGGSTHVITLSVWRDEAALQAFTDDITRPVFISGHEGYVESCNSVYAPLGVRVGAERLVDMAERLGWNRPVPFAGARHLDQGSGLAGVIREEVLAMQRE